jgi:hypothetical protein
MGTAKIEILKDGMMMMMMLLVNETMFLCEENQLAKWAPSRFKY